MEMYVENKSYLLLLFVIAFVIGYFFCKADMLEVIYDYIIIALDFVATETPHVATAGV